MKLITIAGKFWKTTKLVKLYWWILRYNFWDDQGVWIDEKADLFFNEDLS